jgi:hypothetical protein
MQVSLQEISQRNLHVLQMLMVVIVATSRAAMTKPALDLNQ